MPGSVPEPLAQRLAVLRRLRVLLAERGLELAELAGATSRAEALAAQIIPLAAACRFLEQRAATLLAPRRERSGRPFWLGGCDLTIYREPCGVVLIIAPSNYPVLLPGVQVVQALTAGNTVLLKPGHGGRAAADWLAAALTEAGLPDGRLTVLDEPPSAAQAAIAAGVDKVLLTGAAETGRALLATLAPGLIPAVLELSGCDPVLVLADADPEQVAAALLFGLRLNNGATCIAPRRVLVAASLKPALETRLAALAATLPPLALPAQVRTLAEDALAQGARLLAGRLDRGPLLLTDVPPQAELLRADVMAPVLSLLEADGERALAWAADCPYALGATVFSRDTQAAQALAARLPAGLVIINDLIMPSADPRLPFAGRGLSGYGVTRGAEGLLELTRIKAVITRRRGRLRHLEPPQAGDEALLHSYLKLAHGQNRWQALRALLRAVRGRMSQSPQEDTLNHV